MVHGGNFESLMDTGCYSFLHLRVLLLSKSQIELIKIDVIFILNVLILIHLMHTGQIKGSMSPHFKLLMCDHHLIEFKDGLSILHMKGKRLELVNDTPNYFC